jgi:hypothetical protein
MDAARRRAVDSVGSILAQLEAMDDPGPKWREANGGWTTESRAIWRNCFRTFAIVCWLETSISNTSDTISLANSIITESSEGRSSKMPPNSRGSSVRSGPKRCEGVLAGHGDMGECSRMIPDVMRLRVGAPSDDPGLLMLGE